MYDRNVRRWLIVDANREQGLDAFEASLSTYRVDGLTPDNPLLRLKGLLETYSETSRDEFFTKYLDIYWEKYELLLKLLSEKKLSKQ